MIFVDDMRKYLKGKIEIFNKKSFLFLFLFILTACSKEKSFTKEKAVILPAATGEIGDIYSKSSWTDLSDFETNTGFSVNNGKIKVSGGAGYLRLPGNTKLDVWKISVQYKLIDGVESKEGLQIGMQSSNTTFPLSIFAVGNLNPSNIGKSSIKNIFTAATYFSSASINVKSGEHLVLEFVKDKATFTATWTNQTTSQSVAITADIPNNTSKVAILGGTATYEIQSIIYSSPQMKSGIWTIGDSNTDGFTAGSVSNRWSELLGATGISAGAGDKTSEVISRMNEIINIIHPTKIYIMIGSNDVNFGISSNTWQANYASIVTQLETAGIKVIKIASPPNNNRDLSVVKNWLASTYPTTYIDIYTPLVGPGNTLKGLYDVGDGLHLNAAGNLLIKNTIVASGL